MELEFAGIQIPCLRTVVNHTQKQELLQEVRLTEGMPDIGKVLTSYGQVLIRGKEWRSDSMSVSGGVMAWVLYAPEDGSLPQWVEAWLPFQMRWDFTGSERDGSIIALPLLQALDARSVSARKVVLRADVAIKGQGVIPDSIEVCYPKDIPDDICILQQRYPAFLPVEAGERTFNIEDTLSLPATAQELDKIVCYSVRPDSIESKIVSDKAVFKGNAVLHLLYMGKDQRLYSCDLDIPFSQYVQLDKEYDGVCSLIARPVVSDQELVQDEEGKMQMKAGLVCQYVVCDQSNIEIVEDAYSVRRHVRPEISGLTIPALLDSGEQTIKIEQTAAADAAQIVDTVIYIESPDVHVDEMKVSAELMGRIDTLYYEKNGQLVCAASPWKDLWTESADSEIKTDLNVRLSGIPGATLGGDMLIQHANITINRLSAGGRGMPMVTSVVLGEEKKMDPNRPSVVLRNTGTYSIWEMAKQNGSTVELIEEANGISRDDVPTGMLLIPVV